MPLRSRDQGGRSRAGGGRPSTDTTVPVGARIVRSPRAEEFRAVALGFLGALYNAAVRSTGDEAEAEDLVQQTYLEAFRHAEQLRDLSRCKAWLFRILRNLHVSRSRSLRARPELVVVEGGLETAEDALAGDRLAEVEREQIARLARPAIEHALASLSEELRGALLLCDVEGFTYQEIAQILECPIGTVRSRISRARAQLTRQLAAHASGFGVGKGFKR